MTNRAEQPPVAIVDLDGTLIDSTYQHALALAGALRDFGVDCPIWTIHRLIGMGGDRIVEEAAGPEVEQRVGDAIREREDVRYAAMIPEIGPLPGARDLLEELSRRGARPVIASSANEDEVEHFVDLLEVRDTVAAWTSAASPGASKPDPESIHVALGAVDARRGVMIGDSIWDCEAASRAGVPSIGLLSGGFSEAELREAGAATVFASPRELRDGIDRTPLVADSR